MIHASDQMQTPPKKKKKAEPKIPLMELLAINSTAAARKLLKHYGAEDATSYVDLEHKLARLYENTKNKGGDLLSLEKDLAQIHPHQEFILKRLCPPPVITKTTVKIPELTAPADGMQEEQSNCAGNPNCNCGKMSSFDSKPTIIDTKRLSKTEIIAGVAVIAIIATAAVIIHHHKRKYR